MSNLKFVLLLFSLCYTWMSYGSNKLTERPRILISTDIGGTDPDDNQSMAHLLMYCGQFDIEGLVSSPSFGNGSKQEILKMIGLYEKDLPDLKKHLKNYTSPDVLRSLCKQGRHGSAPYKGYAEPTEGSEWIIKCAKKKSERPLWVLVWGGLEDVAQALHDAPEIASAIKVYWIGGPNKKWSVNSYSYIVSHFPELWIIENNASYRGLISNNKILDKFNKNYYDEVIRGSGHLGSDFINYYDGLVKMGDTPSLLYMMDGDPNNPTKECWGGSFEKLSFSPRMVFNRSTTLKDTVSVYSVIEFQMDGPDITVSPDSACFTMTVDRQNWNGYYLGNGKYAVRYSPKAAATLNYKITSDIVGFPQQEGVFVVSNLWPGKSTADSYSVGQNWYTDKQEKCLFEAGWQGSGTVSKWRKNVLTDWEKRWKWLKK